MGSEGTEVLQKCYTDPLAFTISGVRPGLICIPPTGSSTVERKYIRISRDYQQLWISRRASGKYGAMWLLGSTYTRLWVCPPWLEATDCYWSLCAMGASSSSGTTIKLTNKNNKSAYVLYRCGFVASAPCRKCLKGCRPYDECVVSASF